MENFIKSFLISLLASGSFVSHAMENDNDLDKAIAASLNMTLECYYELAEAATSFNMTVEEYYENQEAISLGLPIEDYRAALNAEKSRSQKSPTHADTRSDWEIACQLEQMDLPQMQQNPFEIQQQIILDRAIAEVLQAELSPISGIITQEHTDRILSAIAKDRDVLKQFGGNFKEISLHIQKIPNNHDVHILDDYVFGGQSQIANLLGVGRHLAIDNGSLTWIEIQENLLKMLPKIDADWVSDYEGKAITAASLKGHIATYFGNLPNELTGFFGSAHPRCDQVRELWSRAISLTALLEPYDPAILLILAQCISENYLTEGGCIQGRINRIFLRYVALLGAAGINDTIQIVEALSS